MFYYLGKNDKGSLRQLKNRQNVNVIFNLNGGENDEKIKNGQNDKNLKKGDKMGEDGKNKKDKDKDKKDKGSRKKGRGKAVQSIGKGEVRLASVNCCYVHVCFIQVTSCGVPDALMRLGARTFLLLTHLLGSQNKYQ